MGKSGIPAFTIAEMAFDLFAEVVDTEAEIFDASADESQDAVFQYWTVTHQQQGLGTVICEWTQPFAASARHHDDFKGQSCHLSRLVYDFVFGPVLIQQ